MGHIPTPDEFESALGATTDAAVRYLKTLHDGPVLAPSKELAVEVPDGIGLSAALAHFVREYEPHLSRSAGPRYWGFVTGGATPASVAGDWLTAIYDQNASHRLGSIAAEIERATVAACAGLWDIAPEYHGQFVSGATASNLVALATAREWAGRRSGVDISRHGVSGAPIRVLAGAPHASIGKALSILGLGRDAIEAVPCVPGRTVMDIAELSLRLAASRVPTIILAAAGEVNTGDFDDLVAIGQLAKQHEAWLHVDGAFGLFAALAATHRSKLDGLNEASSITVDLHKWMNVPYDSALIYCKHPELQRAVFEGTGAYLGADVEPFHFTPENSRRLRALPVWFTLAAYGRQGIASWVEANIRHAQRFAELLQKIPGVRSLSPTHLNIVCFGFENGTKALRDDVIAHVTASGAGCLTPTTLFDTPAIRAAFVNWRTTERDLETVAQAIEKALARR